MKHNSSGKMNVNLSDRSKAGRRRELARGPRCLLILLVFVLFAASLLAAYARFRPVLVPIPSLAYRYERISELQYQIQNEPSPIMDQTIQGMDLVYLSTYARAILPVFTYRLTGDRDYNFKGNYQVIAVLRLRSQYNPGQVVFEKTVPIGERTLIQMTGREFAIQQSVQVPLEEYKDLMSEFGQESDLQANYELEIGMQVNLDVLRGDMIITQIKEKPSLSLPLGEDTFTIRVKPLPEKRENVWLVQTWQLLLTPLPIWVYPIASGLCLLILILIFVTTKPRRKHHFHRQVRRMIRKAKGRLMLIGDKAWEPEWCISVANFRTMVRTAKKLKHPIFCYVEKDTDRPVAYFYVYYGENNYCFTFTGTYDKKEQRRTKNARQDIPFDVQDPERAFNRPAAPQIRPDEPILLSDNQEQSVAAKAQDIDNQSIENGDESEL